MFCAQCGTQCLPDHKFCKGCGAAIGAPGSTLDAPPLSAAPQLAAVPPAPAPPPPPPIYTAAMVPPPLPPVSAPYPQAPPPGMTAVMYQAYPGGPQQIYYVPAGTHPHAQSNFLEGLRSRIRNLASTESLEGFSFAQMFSEVFKRHGSDAVEEYFMVGGAKTTPPIELVETGWPKPWMFFRLLAFFVVAFVVLDIVWNYTGNTPMVPAIMIMGAFAVPLATLVLIFEMNTPRNVSLVLVGKLFLMGGLAALCAVSFEYMFKIAGDVPGIVEETAKLAAVLLVVHSARYKYELNGILFGAAVGAGFASFETSFYGLINSFLPTLIQSLQQGAQQGPAYTAAMQSMVDNLAVRGVLAPFGHVAWTAIAAGAFWRVKYDQPMNPGMLLDSRFLKAFAIPVLMHTAWDLSILIPTLSFGVNLCLWIGTGATTWYVLFGLVQQGLRQVKEEQKTHLQSTLANVESTLALGTVRA
jgi:RsiW-degrading membrane proteinase PrsW (M82 family)